MCNSPDCGFRFFDLQTWADPYKDTDYYQDSAHPVLHPDASYIRARVALLKKFVEGGRVAELGCGFGETAICLKRAGYEVSAVDESRHSIAYLRERFDGIEWVCGDLIEFLDAQSRPFDAVTMFHTLEHVPLPKRVISSVDSTLRDGGAIVIEVPDASGGQARLRGDAWDYFIRHHVNYFDVRSLTKLMSEFGYKRRYTERTFHLSYPQGHLAKDLIKGLLGRLGYNSIIRTVWLKH